MQGNPFYVDPFGGYGKEIVRGLSGLGAVLGERQQIKQAQEEEAMLMQEAQDVFASNDPNRIAEFSLKAPKFAQRVSQAVGFKNDATRQNMIDSTQRILMGEDPEQVIIERAQMVQAQGGDPINTLQELDVYRQDPQAFMRNAERAYALLNPQGYAAFRQAVAPVDSERLSGDAGTVAQLLFGTSDLSRLTPEQRQQVGEEVQRRGGTGQSTANMAEYNLALQQGYNGSFLDFINERSGRGDVKLSAFAEKQLSAATNEAVEATNNVERFTALADELEAADFGGGLFGGSWREKLKDITGQQDAVTELRKKFNGIKASQVVNNLPPGAASDADIALALSGFPSDNYNAAQLSSFMRGLAKLEGYRGQFAEFRANYISENKNESGLLKAWKAQTDGDGNAAPRSQTSAPSAAQIEQAAKILGITPEQYRQDMGL